MKNKKLLKEIYTVKKRFDDIFRGDHLEIDKNGKILIASCIEYLNFIDLNTGERLYKLYLNDNDGDKSVENEEYIVTFSYNNDDLIIASNIGLIRHYKLTINNINNDVKIEIKHLLQRTWKSMHIGPIATIKFDITGELIVTGGSDGTIKLWNLIKKYCTHNFKNNNNNNLYGIVKTITFAPRFTNDSYQIFASGDDYHIHVWNLINSKYEYCLDGHESTVTDIIFTADQKYFLSSSRDKLIIIWQWSKMLKYRTMAVYESIETMLLIPMKKFSTIFNNEKQDQEVLVVAGNDGLIRIWNYQNGQKLYEQTESLLAIENKDNDNQRKQYTQINQLIYQLNNEKIIAISYDKDIVFHNVQTMKPSKQMIGAMNEVLDLKFIGNDNNFIAVATNNPKIRIINLSTSNCSFLIGHTDIVLSLSVFPNDRHLMISSSKDNTIRVWKFDPENCLQTKCLYKGSGHTHSITSLATSSLNDQFVVSGSEDTTIKLWKIPKVDSNETIIDLRAKYTQCCHEKTINSIDVAPNDELIATGSQDRTAKLWSTKQLKLLSVYRGHRKGIWTVKFSPVDRILATGSADSTIKLWPIGTEQQSCLRTFEGHESSVLKLQFIDDGIQLLSSSSDGNLKLWSLQTNDCRKTFDAHEGKIWAMDISNDEQMLVTGSDDSTIALWLDCTIETKEKEQFLNEQLIENEQILQNLLQQKQWFGALLLSIQFEYPLRCLKILKELQLQYLDLNEFIELLSTKLNEKQLSLLFEYSIHWNTNSKHWLIAQCIINACIRKIPPTELNQLFQSNNITKLLPYCQRHQLRIQRLRQMTTFVDFVFEQMKISK